MRILITGANGEVGKEIALILSKNKSYKLGLLGNKKNKTKPNYFFQNLLKPIKLKFKPQIIIHCAAKHPNSKIGSEMKNIYSTNIKITENLINFANKNKVRKVFFLSSIAVYGQIRKTIIHEKQKPINQNLYEKSKLVSEKLFCKKKNKFKTVCLRIPGVFTANLNKDYPLITKILKKIKSNKSLEIYNSNKKFNNVVDVLEITNFINFLLNKEKIHNGVYNFSASEPIKFLSVIQLIKKLFKSKSNVINKISHKKSFIISNSKTLKKLNFKTSSTKDLITRCCKNIIKKNKI